MLGIGFGLGALRRATTSFDGLYAFDFTGQQNNLNGKFTSGTGFTGGDEQDLVRAPWTFTRATTKYVEDHEGIWQKIPSGAMPLSGFRTVWNRLSSTEDVSSGWTFNNGAASTSSTGVSFDGSASGRVQQNISGFPSGEKLIFSVDIRLVSGTPTNVSLVLASTAFPSPPTVEISALLTGEFKRFQVAGTSTAAGTAQVQVRDYDGVAFAIEMKRMSAVVVPSSATVDPGYVSSDDDGFGADGFAYFTTENGNSVASNVVTEAAGTTIAIDDARGDTTAGVWGRQGYVPEPARTNAFEDSYDLTQWVQDGTSVSALDETGITGASNTATTLTDDNASGFERVQGVYTTTAAEWHLSVYIKADSNTSRFPEIGIHSSQVAAATGISVQLNTSTGATAHRGTPPSGGYSATRVGDWWRLDVQWLAAAATSSLSIYPAISSTLGSASSSATGSIIVGHAQAEAGSTPTSPIVTTGSTATRNADALAPVDATETDTDWTANFTVSSEETQTAVDLTADASVQATLTTVPNGEAVRTLEIVDGS